MLLNICPEKFIFLDTHHNQLAQTIKCLNHGPSIITLKCMWFTVIWKEMRVSIEVLRIYLIVKEDFENAWLSYFQFCCDIA
jgi:hypothetical protein